MRRLALTLCVLALALSAGCLDGDLQFNSEPAAIDEATLSETGYTLVGNETQTIAQPIDIDGDNRTISLESHSRTYERAVSIDGRTETARVVIFTTPAVDLGGKSRNPYADRASRDLLASFHGVPAADLHRNVDQSLTVLGTTRSLGTYDYDGETLGLLRFRHDGDLLVVYTAVPQNAGEESRLATLLGGIVHEPE